LYNQPLSFVIWYMTWILIYFIVMSLGFLLKNDIFIGNIFFIGNISYDS
jgi:hypothetical protein